MQTAIRALTISTLVTACVLCAWWWTEPDVAWFQPASTFLALLSAIAGIPADRWAVAAERRRRTLASLRHEIEQNQEFFAHPAFLPASQGVGLVYPRLKVGAVDTAFLAGALYDRRDARLRQCLLDWRSAAEDLNRRLDVTEVRLCTVESIDPDEVRALRGMVTDSTSYFRQAAERLAEVRQALELSQGRRNRPVLPRRHRPTVVPAEPG